MRLVHRRMRPEDRTFVVNAWLRGLQRSMHSGLIAAERWAGVMVPELEAVLDLPRTHVLVLADADATDHVADLFGFIVWQPPDPLGSPLPMVFYAYVKRDARGRGLARHLMRAAGVDPAKPYDFACRTHAVDSLRNAGKLPHAYWNPLGARRAISTKRTPDGEAREACAT